MASLEFKAAIEGRLHEFVESRVAIAVGGMMKAAGLAGRSVLGRLRGDVLAAGMGARLSNTWRSLVYPNRGKSIAPAVVIFSKAPHIVAAYSDGGTIRPKAGKLWLWIPTENVGRSAGRAMTPEQVENRYNTDLEIIPAKDSRGIMLAVIKAVKSKNKRGFRQATPKRLASGRDIQLVVMFVLVKQVRLQRRLNTRSIATEAERDWPETVGRSLIEAFRNDEAAA